MPLHGGKSKKYDGGFTFIETLASLSLVLLVFASVSGAFLQLSRNSGAAFENIREAWHILSFDQRLRKKIEPLIVPYWENSLSYTEDLRKEIMSTFNDADITIIAADAVLKDKSSCGLEVSYRYRTGGKKYASVCLFSSRGDGVER
jgi:hypothetical protein